MIKRSQSAGDGSGTSTRRGWILKDKPAGQDQGMEEGAWAGAQRGEVLTELRKGGGALEVRMWDVNMMAAEHGDEVKATWCSGFFL